MAPFRNGKKSTRKAAETVPCPNCGLLINKMGLGRHQGSAKCIKTAREAEHGGEILDSEVDPAFEELLDVYIESNTFRRDQPMPGSSRQAQHHSDSAGFRSQDHEECNSSSLSDLHESQMGVVDIASMTPPLPNVNDDNLCHDDIKVEYHPRSQKAEKVFHFEDYKSELPSEDSAPPTDSKPWKPFRTRLDFELAEFMLDAHLNEKQSADLLSLIRKCIASPDEFTFENGGDLKKCWSFARELKATGFTTIPVSVPYKDEEITFDVTFRPLWEWCLDLLENPTAANKFKWDAERHYKYNSVKKKWIRFIDEPWTADAWWEIQSRLPKGAHPLCLILYADKSRLSSFGTAKGYPVMARCANLPIDMRNGEGIGGSRVVGFLPIVAEDAGETGKTGFVNFKRVVWHKSFYEIIKSLEGYAKTGYWFKAGETMYWLFPIILILSADYEEQCVMALIRGTNSKHPCPICLVPGDKLTDFSECYDLRTHENMESVHADAQDLNLKDANKLLQSYGLRNVENVFWNMQGTDVYSALSFDRLHNNHGGFFSDHLWETFKSIVDGNHGKRMAAQVDERVDQIPRWSGLNHFSGIMKAAGEYTDGTKYEDMSKILIFATESILTPATSKQGHRLLELMRSYLELDMYTALTVHTDETLQAAEEELQVFGKVLQKYSNMYPDKSWNFPKAHAFRHAFDDIRKKGVTRNYNTKPFEKAHTILKHFYQRQSNFKNVIPQLIKLNEADLACQVVRTALNHLDELNNISTSDDVTEVVITGTHHVSLGSPSAALSLDQIEKNFSSDSAFKNFRKRLAQTLTSHLRRFVNLNSHHIIMPYKYLKVNYESTISWKQETNILRINPEFHGRPRHDYILIQVDVDHQTYIFAQLLQVFGISIEDKTYHMALILPMDEAVPIREGHQASDKALRITRIRERHRSKTVFINVESIVRGGLVAHVCSEGEQMDEHLVIDVIDEDMWWRMKSVNLVKHAKF